MVLTLTTQVLVLYDWVANPHEVVESDAWRVTQAMIVFFAATGPTWSVVRRHWKRFANMPNAFSTMRCALESL